VRKKYINDVTNLTKILVVERSGGRMLKIEVIQIERKRIVTIVTEELDNKVRCIILLEVIRMYSYKYWKLV